MTGTVGRLRASHGKISLHDVELANSSDSWNHHKSKGSSSQRRHSSGRRKSKVHPAMINTNDTRRKPNLKVDTSSSEGRSPPTPNGVRGTRDLRSPGMPKSPKVAIPDFITQTDANGNATTPRSAQAIQGARAAGKMDDGNESDDSSSTLMEEACDSIVDSFRMMCCCLNQTDLAPPTTKKLSSKETQDSDENVDTQSNRPKLLGEIHPNDTGKKCLVLDLDETLVHSSFRAVEGADFVIPVKIEDVVHFVYVMKRPGVDEFLVEMAKHYEIVIYTASLNKYADPLLDLLDPKKVIRYRLFRESCVFYEGNYVKDLSVLDRDLSSTIIIDNSPNSYLFHPENAIDCSSFIDDPRDRELDQIGSFLAGIKDAKDVRGLAPQWKDWPVINPLEEESR